MKQWNSKGTAISIHEIDNLWDGGVYYVLVESKEDLRVLNTIRERLELRHLECFNLGYNNPALGLYKRGACDYFEWIAPLLA